MRSTGLLLTLACLISVAAPVAAHQFAPALLELEEAELGEEETVEADPVAARRVTVRWKQPVVRVQGSDLQPVLPPECEGVGSPVVTREGTGLRASWEMTCPGGLVGKAVGVEGIASSQADVLLRVATADGRRLRRVLTADEPSFTVPGGEDAVGSGRLAVFTDYLALGFEHILAGWDHLLFVLALVLLIGPGRRLLWTVTAFTLGHSVTLAAAVLGIVRVPQGPIEAGIAFSIYLLAVELALSVGRGREGKTTPTRRHPWWVAGGFGLVHGLGFAGALSEAGLPADEIPLALFSFNVGIEAGQLAFVLVVLTVTTALRAVPWRRFRLGRLVPVARAAPAYVIGAFAVYWCLERVIGLFGA